MNFVKRFIRPVRSGEPFSPRDPDRSTRRIVLQTLVVVLALGVFGAALGFTLFLQAAFAAQTSNRAAIVVDYGNGQTTDRCIEFGEEQITGIELLARTGLDVNVDANNAIGVAVCKIGGAGCTYPAESCFCQCQGASCVYWSYWRGTSGGWTYSDQGASNRPIRNGDMDGWVWGAGSTGNAPPPPPRTFDEVCAPIVAQATATATATNSPTTTSTLTPTATATIPPTETTIPFATETFAPPNTRIPPVPPAPATRVRVQPTQPQPQQIEPSATPDTAQAAPPEATAPAAATVTRVSRRVTPPAVARGGLSTRVPNQTARAAPPAVDTAFLSAAAIGGGLVIGGCGLVVLLSLFGFYYLRRKPW